MARTVFQCRFCNQIYDTEKEANDCENEHRNVESLIKQKLVGKMFWAGTGGYRLSMKAGDGGTSPSFEDTFIQRLCVVTGVKVTSYKGRTLRSRVKIIVASPFKRFAAQSWHQALEVEIQNKAVIKFINEQPLSVNGYRLYAVEAQSFGFQALIEEMEFGLRVLRGEKVELPKPVERESVKRPPRQATQTIARLF